MHEYCLPERQISALQVMAEFMKQREMLAPYRHRLSDDQGRRTIAVSARNGAL